MSAAIALTRVKAPAQTGATDSQTATDTAAPGQDFASLLIGQLAAGAGLPPDLRREAGLPSDPDSAAGSGGIQDPSSLLAALGIAQPPTAVFRAGDTTLSPDPASPAIGRDGLPAGLEPNSRDPDASPPGSSSANTGRFALPDGASDGGKAAIIAASDVALAGKDGGLTQNPASGTEAGAVPVAAALGHAPGNKGAAAPPPLFEPARPGRPAGETATAEIPSNPLSASGVQNLATAGNQAPATIAPLATPLHDPAWATDFSQRIVWMAANDKQVAHLTVNPPDMGPIEISLNLNKDGASAYFVSSSADVRESIETALPRLKEMLAGAGIELGQSNVGSQSFQQQAGNGGTRQGSPRWIADNAILGAGSAGRAPGQTFSAQRGNGLVDTFA
ncbi:MAG: flagellar hook-length control protein FliK [Betaproteobacteria bacterium]|nr:flagellar hook-length control protein FliK [Betaproteobacteria bacterium]